MRDMETYEVDLNQHWFGYYDSGMQWVAVDVIIMRSVKPDAYMQMRKIKNRTYNETVYTSQYDGNWTEIKRMPLVLYTLKDMEKVIHI